MFRTQLIRAETKVLDSQGGRIEAVVSTETRDRAGDIIRQDGWDLAHFRKHPVLLSSHNYLDLRSQIGEWEGMEVVGKKLVGVARYYIGEGNEQADWGFKLATKGRAAFSVGFLPDMTKAVELAPLPNSFKTNYEFKSQELLEASQIIIPCNAEALQRLRTLSLDPAIAGILDETLREMPQDGKVPDGIFYESYFDPSGVRRYRAKVVCPQCSSERWVDRRATSKETFTGLCHSCNSSKSGKDHPMFRGGIWRQSNGYVGILVAQEDPFASMRDARGYVYAHRYEVAKHLNRSLETYEHVHHLNGDKEDNRIENLALVGEGEHLLITKLQARIQELEGLLIQRPFPAEHSCRLRDPGDFKPESFRRMEREHDGKKYSIIAGRLKGEDTMTEQAYRYPKDTWGAGAARSHCKAHDGSFEAASEEAGMNLKATTQAMREHMERCRDCQEIVGEHMVGGKRLDLSVAVRAAINEALEEVHDGN